AIAHGGHGDGLNVAAGVGLRDADSSTFIALGHQRKEAPALLLRAIGCNHIRNEYMRVYNSGKAHPAAREVFDNLYIGQKVKAQAAIGFRDSRAEDTKGFELINEFIGIGIVLFKIMSYRDYLAIHETANLVNDSLPICIKRCIHESELL